MLQSSTPDSMHTPVVYSSLQPVPTLEAPSQTTLPATSLGGGGQNKFEPQSSQCAALKWQKLSEPVGEPKPAHVLHADST